jgi:uncharacterized C2H2 Zn-finger protein
VKSIRCMLGRHTGQAEGGTLMFWCPRCEESFWQEKDLRHIQANADFMIEHGQCDQALDVAQAEIRKAYGKR